MVRQAAEWGGRYQFWSCADINVYKDSRYRGEGDLQLYRCTDVGTEDVQCTDVVTEDVQLYRLQVYSKKALVDQTVVQQIKKNH